MFSTTLLGTSGRRFCIAAWVGEMCVEGCGGKGQWGRIYAESSPWTWTWIMKYKSCNDTLGAPSSEPCMLSAPSAPLLDPCTPEQPAPSPSSSSSCPQCAYAASEGVRKAWMIMVAESRIDYSIHTLFHTSFHIMFNTLISEHSMCEPDLFRCTPTCTVRECCSVALALMRASISACFCWMNVCLFPYIWLWA